MPDATFLKISGVKLEYNILTYTTLWHIFYARNSYRGGKSMKNTCLFERFLKVVLGLFFLFISAGFMLSGITVFPIFGFLIAFPLLFFSFYFFRAHLNKACQIERAI